jgi:hypothetical protein
LFFYLKEVKFKNYYNNKNFVIKSLSSHRKRSNDSLFKNKNYILLIEKFKITEVEL